MVTAQKVILPARVVERLRDFIENRRSGSITLNIKEGRFMGFNYTGNERFDCSGVDKT